MFLLLATRLWLILSLLLIIPGLYSTPQRSKLPAQGVVPDEATAVKIAEAVFPPVFSEEEISKYRPYQAKLADGVWTVYGTLKRGSRGGTPMITIQRKDGRVVEIWHSQ